MNVNTDYGDIIHTFVDFHSLTKYMFVGIWEKPRKLVKEFLKHTIRYQGISGFQQLGCT